MEEGRTHDTVMSRGVIRCVIVTKIIFTGGVVHDEMALRCTIYDSIESHVYGLEFFSLILLLAKSSAVELSTCICIGGWG